MKPPASDGTPLAGYRSWVVGVVLVIAVIGVALIAGKPKHESGADVPHVVFGAKLEPPAGSAGYLQYTNGWKAVSGGQTIAVYAGSQPSKRENGVLVIQRGATNAPTKKSIVLHGSGALTLLRPPAPATESDAFNTTLHFVTANGATGTLNPSTGRTVISG